MRRSRCIRHDGVETSVAAERFELLEPKNTGTSERAAHTLIEHCEIRFDASGASDQTGEPFLASIVRLEQSDAEEVFRKALN